MNPSTDFELFTQRIYQKLVDNDVLKPTTVQHNVKLKGKSGCEHQIDVYWEYEIAACYPLVSFLTGHCTGKEAFRILQSVMGSKLQQFACGMQIDMK